MNLQEALQSARDGNFVTNEYFDQSQSLHYWRGQFYYEDGAVVDQGWLRYQEFAKKGIWSICIPKEKVDTEGLSIMHINAKGLMLGSGRSYMECVL